MTTPTPAAPPNSPPAGTAATIEIPPERGPKQPPTTTEAGLEAANLLYERAMRSPNEPPADPTGGEDPNPDGDPGAGDDAPPPAAPKKEDAPPTAAKPKAAAPKQAAKPKAAAPAPKPAKEDEPPIPKAPPRAPRRESAMDPEDVAHLAATAAAAAVRSSAPAAPAATDRQSDKRVITADDLPEDYGEYFEALKILPEVNPKFKGRDLTAEIATAYEKEQSYRAAWERKNKGKTFDPDDEEHVDFYSEHRVEISPADLRKADREVMRRSAVEDAKKAIIDDLGPEVEDLKVNRRLREFEEPVQAAANTIELAVVRAALGDDADAVLKEGVPAVQARLQEDPDIQRVAARADETARGIVNLATRAVAGVERLDPERNQAHANFVEFLGILERSVAAGVIDAPAIGGKQFISREELVRLPERKRAGYYTVASYDQLPVLVAGWAAGRVSSAIKSRNSSFERMAARMGYTKASSASPTPAPKPGGKPGKQTPPPADPPATDGEDDDGQTPSIGSRDGRVTGKPDGDAPAGLDPGLWNRAMRKIIP